MGEIVWPLQSQAMAFYGNPAAPGWYDANMAKVICPWPIKCGGAPVRDNTITIHKKCAASLQVVLENVWDAVKHDPVQIAALHYGIYDGCYNFRPMRGGSNLSMHSFACAIDWDAGENPFHSARHLFTDNSLLVVKFKAQGWIWGGDWSPSSVDAMHFQAARVHP